MQDWGSIETTEFELTAEAVVKLGYDRQALAPKGGGDESSDLREPRLKLADVVLADANFTATTCKSCHAVEGVDAWPSYVDGAGATVPAGEYYQGARAPALTAIWAAGSVGFHNIAMNCQDCHDGGAGFSTFADLHTGYDTRITDENGDRYADSFTAEIDSVAMAGNVMTVEFSVSDAAMLPYIYVSLYG